MHPYILERTVMVYPLNSLRLTIFSGPEPTKQEIGCRSVLYGTVENTRLLKGLISSSSGELSKLPSHCDTYGDFTTPSHSLICTELDICRHLPGGLSQS